MIALMTGYLYVDHVHNDYVHGGDGGNKYLYFHRYCCYLYVVDDDVVILKMMLISHLIYYLYLYLIKGSKMTQIYLFFSYFLHCVVNRIFVFDVLILILFFSASLTTKPSSKKNLSAAL